MLVVQVNVLQNDQSLGESGSTAKQRWSNTPSCTHTLHHLHHHTLHGNLSFVYKVHPRNTALMVQHLLSTAPPAQFPLQQSDILL